jgi:hypothetical protein
MFVRNSELHENQKLGATKEIKKILNSGILKSDELLRSEFMNGTLAQIQNNYHMLKDKVDDDCRNRPDPLLRQILNS